MEALIGVLIGGVIGYVAAITTLVVEHRRWRKEFKLQYLITERKRREEQCDRIQELFEKSISEGPYYTEIAPMCIRLPEKTKDLIIKAWLDTDRSQVKEKQKLYEEVLIILGTYLSKIDEQIEELTQ
ncbi:hypothetical protein ES703_97441 [subsurface metagenome]